MSETFGSYKEIGIFPREEGLKKKWDKINDNVTVNESQYSFGDEEIHKKFVLNQFSNKDDFKKFKFYREEWYRRGKEFDAGQAPLAVTCELVSTCNLGCTMCYTITDEFQDGVVGATRMLPWKIVKKVIDESSEIGVYSMLFSWRGEATLYRTRDENGNLITFTDVLEYAHKKGILETTSLTHGQTLDEKFAEQLVKAQPNWINFSIDGLEKEYNKIRTPRNKKNDKEYNAFRKVSENIKLLNKVKKKLNSKRPQIKTNTIFPAIFKNPTEYRDYMYNIGVDWVTVNEILDFRVEEVEDSEIKKNWSCSYPFQRLTISANGAILPCTGAHNEEEGLLIGRYLGAPKKIIKQEKKFVEVTLEEMSLKDAWNSKKLNSIRDLHKNNRRCEISNGCKNCRHGMKKRGVGWVPKDWDLENMDWVGHDFKHG